MSGRALPILVNAFLLAYLLDAGVSLADDVLRLLSGASFLTPVRNAVAGLVALWSLLWLPALWITPRLPAGALLALVGSVLWMSTGGAPLPAVLPLETLGLALSAMQMVIGVLVLLRIRRRMGGASWLFQAESFDGPAFSLRHSALATAAAFFVLIPIGAAYGFLSLATWIEAGTRGFMSVDLSGISLDDRSYVRGDREIRLVAMMHIGEDEAYREIADSFASEATIVLEEGVTDERRLLDSGLSYESAALALGLDQQASLKTYLSEADGTLPPWPVLRHADVDMSDLSPRTVEWLGWVVELLNSEGLVEVLRRVGERNTMHPEELSVIEYDILGLRNEHVLVEIDRALPDYRRVIVPWGALHMPFLEEEVLDRGFDESRREQRRLVSWSTILSAL